MSAVLHLAGPESIHKTVLTAGTHTVSAVC